MSISTRIAEYVCETGFESLRFPEIEAAKYICLDTLGAGLAGSSAVGMSALIEMYARWGGTPESTLFGNTIRVPAPHAAFVNGTLAHARELDDFHDLAFVHPSVVVFPAALAVAEARRATGSEFIAALTVGVDLACRLGLACQSYKGWHITSVCGVFGAAAAAAKLLHLDAEQTLNALGIGYIQAAGNRQGVANGALTKRLQAGFAAQSGVLAAYLAEKGITGPTEPIEGAYGLARLYFEGNWEEDLLTRDLGRHFESTNLSIKLYPCCRWTHPAIEAALSLRAEQYTLNMDDITEVFVETPSLPLFDVVSRPLRPNMTRQVDVQFSIPYTVATALLKGNLSIADFEPPAISDPRRRALAERIRVESNLPAFSVKAFVPTSVTIRTSRGEVFQKSVDVLKGSPSSGLTRDEVMAKFKACIEYSSMPIDNASSIVQNMYQLEDSADVHSLVAR